MKTPSFQLLKGTHTFSQEQNQLVCVLGTQINIFMEGCWLSVGTSHTTLPWQDLSMLYKAVCGDLSAAFNEENSFSNVVVRFKHIISKLLAIGKKELQRGSHNKNGPDNRRCAPTLS